MSEYIFPLYQTLVRDDKTTFTLTPTQEKKIIKSVRSMSEDKKIALIRIIIEYARLNEDYHPISLPYKCREISDENNIVSCEFDMSNFPDKLSNMLYKFVVACDEK